MDPFRVCVEDWLGGADFDGSGRGPLGDGDGDSATVLQFGSPTSYAPSRETRVLTKRRIWEIRRLEARRKFHGKIPIVIVPGGSQSAKGIGIVFPSPPNLVSIQLAFTFFLLFS